MQLLGFAGECGVANLLFDRVEGLDRLERLGSEGGLGFERFKKPAPAVAPALCVSEPGLALARRRHAVGQEDRVGCARKTERFTYECCRA
jgi:hypothetical protein